MDISDYLKLGKLKADKATPLYRKLADELAELMRTGRLHAGEKLSPERELAHQLGVSRTTIISAYRYLEEQGQVSTRVGSGTYVAKMGGGGFSASAMPWPQLFAPRLATPMASILKEMVDIPTARNSISFAAGMPDPAYYPLEDFRQIMAEDLAQIDLTDLGYLPTEGYFPLRQTLAQLDEARGDCL